MTLDSIRDQARDGCDPLARAYLVALAILAQTPGGDGKPLDSIHASIVEASNLL